MWTARRLIIIWRRFIINHISHFLSIKDILNTKCQTGKCMTEITSKRRISKLNEIWCNYQLIASFRPKYPSHVWTMFSLVCFKYHRIIPCWHTFWWILQQKRNTFIHGSRTKAPPGINPRTFPLSLHYETYKIICFVTYVFFSVSLFNCSDMLI